MSVVEIGDVVIVGKKLIEYNGDYWHANPKLYKEDFYNKTMKSYAKEIWHWGIEKTKTANDLGYEVFVVWESDYKKDKTLMIDKCKEFLRG